MLSQYCRHFQVLTYQKQVKDIILYHCLIIFQNERRIYNCKLKLVCSAGIHIYTLHIYEYAWLPVCHMQSLSECWWPSCMACKEPCIYYIRTGKINSNRGRRRYTDLIQPCVGNLYLFLKYYFIFIVVRCLATIGLRFNLSIHSFLSF